MLDELLRRVSNHTPHTLETDGRFPEAAVLVPITRSDEPELILTLRRALGLTVFLITHDLDTLYAICDRVAVLADRRVLATAPVAELERLDHPWVQAYFNGPRGRAARASTAGND